MHTFSEIDGVSYAGITDPQLLSRIKEMKPSEYVMYKITTAKRAHRDEVNRLTNERITQAGRLPEQQRQAYIKASINLARPLIVTSSEFVIAETDGSNLKELMALPSIDKTRTTCNNMYTITNTLDIEAARTLVIRSLYNTISNTGSYVHPANIMFIAEFITSRGEPYGATYTGISRQPGGHLSLATLERAGKVFTQNALHGRKEDIRNVSASVAVGTRAAIGDGMFDIAQDIIENDEVKTLMNDDLFTAHLRDDNTKFATYKPSQPTVQTTDIMSAIENIVFDEEEEEITTPAINYDITTIETVETIEPSKRKIVYRVPSELAEVRHFIKTGYPTAEVEKINITTVERKIELPQFVEQPIISQGLIPLSEFIPSLTETEGLPSELDDLLKQFMLSEEEPQLESFPVITLPRVTIPEFPATGVNIARDIIDVRREQVRDLEPL